MNTKSYMGWQSPKDNELAIGETVTVYYDPHDPSKNALTDFHEVATVGMGPAPPAFVWDRNRCLAYLLQPSQQVEEYGIRTPQLIVAKSL